MELIKRTYKVIDEIKGQKCSKCSHERKFKVVEERYWVMLFVLPLFPYKKRDLLVCSVCGAAYELKEPLKVVKKVRLKPDPDKALADIKAKLDDGKISENEYIRLCNLIKYKIDDAN